MRSMLIDFVRLMKWKGKLFLITYKYKIMADSDNSGSDGFITSFWPDDDNFGGTEEKGCLAILLPILFIAFMSLALLLGVMIF